LGMLNLILLLKIKALSLTVNDKNALSISLILTPFELLQDPFFYTIYVYTI
jgi:hypothetical protein